MGSTVSIIIAVVAVVVGFLVLRNIDDGGSSGGNTGGNTPSSVATDGSTGTVGSDVATESTVATSTTAAIALDPTQGVVVANASGKPGVAGTYTTALAGVGFTMATATNGTGGPLATSTVYYVAGGEAVAASVAQLMSSPEAPVATAPMPAVVPITGAVMPAGATVLVMLGTDKAGLALPGLSNTPASTATTLPGTGIDATTSSTVAG